MPTTTCENFHLTLTRGGERPKRFDNELVNRYRDILDGRRLHWTSHHQLQRMLGSGGQGVVFLTDRRGADGFTLPLALKIFSPARYADSRKYEEVMGRMAHVSALVAQIQQDNLLDVHNFVDRNRIRMMVMEWVDGYDLRQLLVPSMLDKVQHRVSTKRWEYINSVIVTEGPEQPRVKRESLLPSFAIASPHSPLCTAKVSFMATSSHRTSC